MMNSAGRTAAAWILFGFLLLSPLMADTARSFDELFPGLTRNQRSMVFNNEGFKRAFLRSEPQAMVPARNSGIDLLSIVSAKQPSHLIEALLVVPYETRRLNKLDAYNALGRIREIKDYLYFSRRRNMDVPVFEETTRLESDRRRNPIPDPPPSRMLPVSDTMYIRLKDAFFGNIYVRGDIYSGRYGLTYDLTNFVAVRYLFFTVMKAEKFSAVIYLEPINEGMLVYGMAAIDVPDFVASRINIGAETERRLTVFIRWIRDGLKAQL